MEVIMEFTVEQVEAMRDEVERVWSLEDEALDAELEAMMEEAQEEAHFDYEGWW